MKVNIPRLKGKLAEKGMTVQQFADQSGVSKTTLYRIYDGTISVKYSTVELIAQSLDVSVEWLIAGDETQNETIPENGSEDSKMENSAITEMRLLFERQFEYQRKQFRAVFILAIALMTFICLIFMIDILTPGAGWLRY
mgnify:CR=1 FL=1